MTRQRVEKVLEMKTFNKDLLEMALMRAIRELDEQTAKLRFLEQSLARTTAEFERRCRDGRTDFLALDLFHEYILQMTRRIDAQHEAVADKNVIVEDIKGCFLEAHKEKRLVEILHERLADIEQKHCAKEDQKEMDSHYNSRGLRR
ncbi:MAG: flagellar export protein FliJ [Chloroflexota bacterium]